MKCVGMLGKKHMVMLMMGLPSGCACVGDGHC